MAPITFEPWRWAAAVTRARADVGVPAVGLGDLARRSIVSADDHWVAASAVRQAIGAWAYQLGPAGGRPSEQAVREAVAVACAVHELAREQADWAGAAGSTAIPLAPTSIGARAGLGAHEVDAAIELLATVGAATRVSEGGHQTVALAAHVLAPMPCAARIGWKEVRSRVSSARGSVAPALAVLRELADAVGPVGDAEAPPVRMSVRDLEERTGYGRSTVAEALATLERARLVDVESRAGRTARFTLRPAAFGRPDLPVVETGAPTAVRLASHTAPSTRMRAVQATTNAAQRSERSAAPPPAGLAAAPVLLGEFAGTPIHAPPGTPLIVERDAEGQWTCRVGPFLVLGPVAEPR